jgi:hypothetical protein
MSKVRLGQFGSTQAHTHTHTHTLTYTHIRTQYKVACAIRVNTDKIAKYVWQAMV